MQFSNNPNDWNPPKTGTYSQSPGPGPTFPKRSVKYVCDHDHKNPGSKEPAEVSDFVNLTTCANMIDRRSRAPN